MNIAPLADVKARFSAYIRKINKEPVVITKNGRPVAVMLGITNEDDLERILLANSSRFQSMLDAAEKRIQKTGGVSHDEVWAKIKAEVQ